MASMQFRTAFRGFNREDVVHYIEFLNNQHNAQIEQLNNQLQNAPKAGNESLQEQLEAALERCAQLEAQLAAMPAAVSTTAEELEAYRRAERAERVAQERAQQICTQANAVLADATAKAEDAAARINLLTEQANAKLQACQEAVAGTQALFDDAVSALYALKPENDI